MSSRDEIRRCRWCGARFSVEVRPGPPPAYCRRSHRQRAYEARRLAASRGLADDEVLVASRTWGDLRDRMYLLETALEDVDRDLGPRPSPADLQAALVDVTRAARSLLALDLDPRAVGGVS